MYTESNLVKLIFIMKYFVLLGFCMLLFSCKNEGNRKEEIVFKAVADTTYLDKNGKSYPFLASIPDSLQTPEQQMIREQVKMVLREHLFVKGNKILLDLNKEQFLATGLTERYYNMLMKNIYDNNRMFDSLGVKDLDKKLADLKRDLAK